MKKIKHALLLSAGLFVCTDVDAAETGGEQNRTHQEVSTPALSATETQESQALTPALQELFRKASFDSSEEAKSPVDRVLGLKEGSRFLYSDLFYIVNGELYRKIRDFSATKLGSLESISSDPRSTPQSFRLTSNPDAKIEVMYRFSTIPGTANVEYIIGTDATRSVLVLKK